MTRNTFICSLHFVGGNGPTEKYPDVVSGAVPNSKRKLRDAFEEPACPVQVSDCTNIITHQK